MKIKNVHIFGGGTVAHITNHLAISAPAYGWTAHKLASLCYDRFKDCNIHLELTKMAGGKLDTNEDVQNRINQLRADVNTKIIFFNCALVDYKPHLLECSRGAEEKSFVSSSFGKHEKRLETKKDVYVGLGLIPANKIINNIRTLRKDIFLVGFKTTCGATKQEMFEKGLNLCKKGSVNLVLVNDTKTHWNMIVTPEEAAYHETDNRHEVLKELVDMAWHRSQLTFTQSTVVAGEAVKWNNERVPDSLRKVVNHCITANAYKVFNGGTVGHFAVKLSDTEFLTSIRKSDFNKLNEIGLVYVKTSGPDTVLAYGAKPSVGGQSQRIVFRDHPNCDCIVHFHCPLRENNPDNIPVVSQREVECGSHQCGKNTSDNLRSYTLTDSFGQLWIMYAVMLDQHGPNIVFNKDTPAQLIIDFIERNFDLSKKTGGYNI